MAKIKNFFFSEKHTMRNSLLIFIIMQFVIALDSLYSKTNPNKNFIIFSIIILASTICLYWILQTINYNHDLEPKHVKLTKNIKTIIAIVAFSLIGEILINYYLPQLLNVSFTPPINAIPPKSIRVSLSKYLNSSKFNPLPLIIGYFHA